MFRKRSFSLELIPTPDCYVVGVVQQTLKWMLQPAICRTFASLYNIDQDNHRSPAVLGSPPRKEGSNVLIGIRQWCHHYLIGA